ncbi:hypothetical protein PQR62_18550 [Herbaspirillum lusitanum]|uniref:Uncharacterized protein n=1 Tax=Herbaspirillum lusitanum TaxID=213312 RepID=A0ABW9AFT4_9BURK
MKLGPDIDAFYSLPEQTEITPAEAAYAETYADAMHAAELASEPGFIVNLSEEGRRLSMAALEGSIDIEVETLNHLSNLLEQEFIKKNAAMKRNSKKKTAVPKLLILDVDGFRLIREKIRAKLLGLKPRPQKQVEEQEAKASSVAPGT